MPIALTQLVADIKPEHTVLFFGAGASVPSQAPTAGQLSEHLASKFAISADGFTLSELASLVEQKAGRQALVQEIRSQLQLKPNGGIVNLPLYTWRSIFTTNYDNLVEQCYERKNSPLLVYSSNFDFTTKETPGASKLFKLHGTIEKDTSEGHQSKIIITEADYDNTETFREHLYDRFKGDLAGGHLIVIGHSLADLDIKSIVERATKIRLASPGSVRISILMYQRDDNRARLMEKRGIEVCFGDIDHFFDELAKCNLHVSGAENSPKNFLDSYPRLMPVTIETDYEVGTSPNVGSMFNGWPASYADIHSGLTFDRSVAKDISNCLKSDLSTCATLLGASGVGKTTAARQAALTLRRAGFKSWEHKGDHAFDSKEWANVARILEKNEMDAVLFIDDAHSHLHHINELLDTIGSERITRLKIILASSKGLWYPRIKSPTLYKSGKEFHLSRLNNDEINKLLDLVETSPLLRPLVEGTFEGFSRFERRRRLAERCEADMFVCMKNIFASEKFDDIILREYAVLAPELQEIYKYVAAMESAGVRVHRQLVVRLLGINSNSISTVLSHLEDIVNEYSINQREGIYGWKGRHSVIVDIIAKYKFSELDKIIDLFERVIDCISPTYEIEVRTLIELCSVETGISRIPDRQIQNKLLRRMMSTAPGERIPRHRLIRNLIEMGEFEKADAEIRIFAKDFRTDGPITRYKINLLTVRAARSPGILPEDRLTILKQAQDLAKSAVLRFPHNKHVLAAYCELGIEVFKQTAEFEVFDQAISALKLAEDRIGDPDISKMIARYERIFAGQSPPNP